MKELYLLVLVRGIG